MPASAFFGISVRPHCAAASVSPVTAESLHVLVEPRCLDGIGFVLCGRQVIPEGAGTAVCLALHPHPGQAVADAPHAASHLAQGLHAPQEGDLARLLGESDICRGGGRLHRVSHNACPPPNRLTPTTPSAAPDARPIPNGVLPCWTRNVYGGFRPLGRGGERAPNCCRSGCRWRTPARRRTPPATRRRAAACP